MSFQAFFFMSDCVADTVMIKERRPNDACYFQQIHGVAPEVVEEWD